LFHISLADISSLFFLRGFFLAGFFVVFSAVFFASPEPCIGLNLDSFVVVVVVAFGLV